MAPEATLVKKLRESTGAGFLDCQKALTEVGGDFEKAIEILRKKGLAAAQKKSGRETREGTVASYIHAGGRLGVLVEVNCETDFVAKTAEFQELVRDIAMQVAASSPQFVHRDEVPSDLLDREKRLFMEQAQEGGKPPQVVEKIAAGRLDKYLSEICLLDQSFVKDPSITIRELVAQKIAKTGENISVKRFVRFQLGE